MKKIKKILGTTALCTALLGVGTGCSLNFDPTTSSDKDDPVVVCTQTDLDALNQRLNEKQTELDAVNALLTEAENNVNAKMNDIEELKAERDILLSQIQSLENQLNSSQGEYVWVNSNSSNEFYMDEAKAWWSNVTLNGFNSYYHGPASSNGKYTTKVLIPYEEQNKDSLNSYIVYYREIFPYVHNYSRTITKSNSTVLIDDIEPLYIGNLNGFDSYNMSLNSSFNFFIANNDTGEVIEKYIPINDNSIDLSSIFTEVENLGTTNVTISAEAYTFYDYTTSSGSGSGGSYIEARFNFDF